MNSNSWFCYTNISKYIVTFVLDIINIKAVINIINFAEQSRCDARFDSKYVNQENTKKN
jgi:hypothetical protein